MSLYIILVVILFIYGIYLVGEDSDAGIPILLISIILALSRHYFHVH